MVDSSRNNKSRLSNEFEKNIALQAVKKLQSELEGLKREITLLLNQKVRASDFSQTLESRWQSYQEKLIEFEAKVAEEWSPNDKEALSRASKMLGSFKEKTDGKILLILRDSPKEEAVSRASTRQSGRAQAMAENDAPKSRKSVKKAVASPDKPVVAAVETSEKKQTKAAIRPDSHKVIEADRQDSDVMIPALENLASESAWFECIKREKNKSKQKEIARHAILWLYDSAANVADINRSLQTWLPYACPQCFAEKNGQLVAKGKHAEDITRALGGSTDAIILDCRTLDETTLDQLGHDIAGTEGLWAILKSFKFAQQIPVDAKSVVDTCLPVLSAISQKEWVQTGKFKQVLNIMAYAGRVAAKAKDDVQLFRMINLCEKPHPNDSKDTIALKSWLSKKAEQSQDPVIIPKELTKNWHEMLESFTDQERQIDEWFMTETRRIRNLKETMYSKVWKDESIALAYKMKEFYAINRRLVANCYMARQIILSRIQAQENGKNLYGLSDEEKALLSAYAEHLENFIQSYGVLMTTNPLPTSKHSLVEVVTQVATMLQSQEFARFIEAKSAIKEYDFIEQINASHGNCLDKKISHLKTDKSLEEREKGLADYLGNVSESYAKLGIHLREISKSISKINKEASSRNRILPYTQSVVQFIENAVAFAAQVGREQNIAVTKKSAEVQLKTESSKSREREESALQNLLLLYNGDGLKKDNSELYVEGYLTKLLPQAFSQRFEERDGKLYVIPEEDAPQIFSALGQQWSSQASYLELHNSQFDAKQLKALSIQFPEEHALWSYLLSLKPVNQTFTVKEKTEACISVLSELSKKELVQSDKLRFALDILAFAFQESKPYTFVIQAKGYLTVEVNRIILTLKDKSLDYQCRDAAYQIQKGDMTYQELGMSERNVVQLCALRAAAGGVDDQFLIHNLRFTQAKIDTLRRDNNGEIPIEELLSESYFSKKEALYWQQAKAQGVDITMAYLQTYFPKILAITTQKGVTFDKPQSVRDMIQALFGKTPLPSQEMNNLRKWLRREMATKTLTEDLSLGTEAQIRELLAGADTHKKINTPVKEEMNPVVAFFVYLGRLLYKWFYDWTHSQSAASTPEQASEKQDEDFEEEDGVEHSSDVRILKGLHFKPKKNDGVAQQEAPRFAAGSSLSRSGSEERLEDTVTRSNTPSPRTPQDEFSAKR